MHLLRQRTGSTPVSRLTGIGPNSLAFTLFSVKMLMVEATKSGTLRVLGLELLAAPNTCNTKGPLNFSLWYDQYVTHHTPYTVLQPSTFNPAFDSLPAHSYPSSSFNNCEVFLIFRQGSHFLPSTMQLRCQLAAPEQRIFIRQLSIGCYGLPTRRSK